jgi:hypothetical protein
MYPSSIVPVEYPTRLLRLSLAHLSPLLDPKGQAVPAPAADSSSSKKGKKRARGAEDGLVGGLEGRDRVNLTEEEVDVIVESLKCTFPARSAVYLELIGSGPIYPHHSPTRSCVIDIFNTITYLPLPRSTSRIASPTTSFPGI